MELEGKVWKDGNGWLIEVPVLDTMTQGKSKKDAIEMIQDAITGLIECYFEDEISKDFSITVNTYKNGVIGITTNDTNLLLALSLRKQREKSGATVREVSERLGSKSPNAYAQYERGKISVSLDKYEELLGAVNPSNRRHLRIV